MKILEYSYNEIYKIKKDWLSLYSENLQLSVFQSYSWYENMMMRYRSNLYNRLKFKCFFLTLYVNNKLIMISPIMIIKQKNTRLTAIADVDGFSDYLDFIYTKNIEDEHFNYMIKYIFEKYHIGKIVFKRIKEDSKLKAFLIKHVSPDAISSEACVKVIYKGDLHEHISKLSKSIRQNIRTAYNRMEKNRFVLEPILITGKIDKKTTDSIFNIYKKRYKIKNREATSYQLVKNLYKNLVDLFHNTIKYSMRSNTDNILFYIRSCDEVVAYFYGLQRNENEVQVVQVAINMKYSNYSPGIVLFNEYFKQVSNSNDSIILDLTRGDEAYKMNIGGTRHYIYNFEVVEYDKNI